jgi:DNA-binding NarL/FixJ family response regulator
VRVALADDSALFRTGLHRLLCDLGVQVSEPVGNAADLVLQVAKDPPDVAILDIRMPPSFTNEGLQAALTLRERQPQVGVLLLSTYAESAYAAQLLAAGRHKVGYLLKDRVDDPAALLDALTRLDEGECVLDAELVTMLLRHERHTAELARLSEREQTVLQLIAEGRSNAGIGRQLFLSRKTVEAHVSAVLTKLDLSPETDANRRVLAALTWLRTRVPET